MATQKVEKEEKINLGEKIVEIVGREDTLSYVALSKELDQLKITASEEEIINTVNALIGEGKIKIAVSQGMFIIAKKKSS